MAANAVVGRRQLALGLRRRRVAAGLTIEDLAQGLECSPAKVSRMETGAVGVRIQDLRMIADLLELDSPDREGLAELVRAARSRGWWQKFADVVPSGSATFYGLEDGATVIEQHTVALVPGLLQTPGYARALLCSVAGVDPGVIERRLALRMRRQQVLDRPDPPRVHMVLDEAVLHRQIGEPTVMAEQWEHLLERAATPGVNIRVVPFSAAAHAAAGVGFTVFGFDDPVVTPVVFTEQLTRNSFVDDPDEVAIYADALAGAERAAASSDKSLEMIAGRARELR